MRHKVITQPVRSDFESKRSVFAAKFQPVVGGHQEKAKVTDRDSFGSQFSIDLDLQALADLVESQVTVCTLPPVVKTPEESVRAARGGE